MGRGETYTREGMTTPVPSKDPVQKSDFMAWWDNGQENEGGYGAIPLYEAFANAGMKPLEKFAQPNSSSYQLVGEK